MLGAGARTHMAANGRLPYNPATWSLERPMLSYRHLFHAGNHGDVLKHLTLTLVLEYLGRKDKPLLYLDTHAGAGLYRLDSNWAQQNREFDGGIARIWQRSDAPQVLRPYLELIRGLNPGTNLNKYPGSPWLARQLLRHHDRACLYELHPAEFDNLRRAYADDRQVKVVQGDGFDALRALLPPLERRALVLMDPPYEVKADYRHVVRALKEAMQRFASGVYLIWYPRVQPLLVEEMLKGITRLGAKETLRLELDVAPGSRQGMVASGVVVLNPPYTLAAQMGEALPWLAQQLGEGGAGAYVCGPLGREA